jgi:glutamate/tyrosine decarboxylase-like PLP-dependent enzyme
MRTMHPYFNDKLYNGSNPIGHMAEYVTSVLNTASHVYHVSPVFSVMEEECVKFFGNAFGMKNVDGVTCPGGSMAIMMSLLAARHEKFPHVRSKGW